MIDSAENVHDIYGNDYRKSDLPEESGISIALYVSFSLCFVVGALICFYCLYPRIRKKSTDDEEKDSGSSASEELQNINTKETTAVNPPQRKISHWDRLGSIFQAKTATTELEYRLQMSNTRKESQTKGNKIDSSSSIYDKPAMGDMTVNLVQPPSRDNNYRSGPSATATKRKSIIPESVLQSLEPWLASEDTQSPQGSDYIGRLQFSVAYAFDSLTLIVKVIKAIDLPPMDLSGSSDPFVKCCLLPDRKRKLESKIRRKTLNPSWNETLLFEGLPYDKIQQRVLYMQVMDWDRFSRNDPIGEVCIPLNHINLADNQPQWEYLTPCKGSNKRGQLLIALCYYPENGTIEVTIKEAKNLKPMDIGGTSDPYVKIWLLVRGKRIEKKKTTTVKNSLNPTFNETFTFNSTMDRLRETQLEINVMDRDYIGRNDTIGKIYLGTKSNSLEKRHWKEMLMKSRIPVEQWHILKI